MSLFDRFWKKQSPETNAPESAEITETDSDNPDELESMLRQAEEEGPARPLLYVFEHISLPEAVFENHPELIRELAEPREFSPLVHFRSKAYIRCLHTGAIEAKGTDTDLDEMEELFQGLAIQPYKRNGYTVHVITMPAPLISPECYFAAIVHKDSEPKIHGQAAPSTQYITLEKSISPRPMLCAWTQDGTHLNYGAGPMPDKEAFVEAVFERIKTR